MLISEVRQECSLFSLVFSLLQEVLPDIARHEKEVKDI
jgi:hypothetical protein